MLNKLKGKDNAKEWEEAGNLHRKMNRFEFVIMLIIWEKLLTAIQITSADLQSMKMDLCKAAKELERALCKVKGMRETVEYDQNGSCEICVESLRLVYFYI